MKEKFNKWMKKGYLDEMDNCDEPEEQEEELNLTVGQMADQTKNLSELHLCPKKALAMFKQMDFMEKRIAQLEKETNLVPVSSNPEVIAHIEKIMQFCETIGDYDTIKFIQGTIKKKSE